MTGHILLLPASGCAPHPAMRHLHHRPTVIPTAKGTQMNVIDILSRAYPTAEWLGEQDNVPVNILRLCLFDVQNMVDEIIRLRGQLLDVEEQVRAIHEQAKDWEQTNA